jgi:putative N6-adenine-specific DNA methylase
MPYFAACSRGLEPLVEAELVALGLKRPSYRKPDEDATGGVEFDGDDRALRLACVSLRTAERVLMKLGSFRAIGFADLVAGIEAIPWERYLPAGKPVLVRADSRASKLYHEKAVAERVLQGISKRLKAEVAPAVGADEDHAPRVEVWIERDECVVALDASGLLHRRGWRLETAKAPLRETLAAALLVAARWDGTTPLIDPFCGSGTIAIEAALLARGTPPGDGRRFPFEDWLRHDGAGWRKERLAAARPAVSPFPKILASDRDEGAIAAAKANAARAGVADLIEFSCRPLSAIEPPPGQGWIVTNPPYGERVSEGKDLRDLYAQLGNLLRGKLAGWSAALLTAHAPHLRATGLNFDSSLRALNGGIPVRLSVHRGR